MPITSLPTPPSRNDPTNFATRADAFLGQLPTFASEANALENNVNGKEVSANSAATTAIQKANEAAASASAAATTAGVTAWNPATNYALGAVVYDTTDYLTYRRSIAGTTATRPGLDPTNWTLITQSLYTPVVSVSALNIDMRLGNYFKKVISTNSTFTFSNLPAAGVGYSFTLEIEHTSGTISWPTTVTWPRGIAPVLTTGRTHLFTFTTSDGGVRWRAAALTDYPT